jgi:Zn-finger protein
VYESAAIAEYLAMKTKHDTCPHCCPASKRAIFEATSDQDGGPVWECRNCHSTKPRRVRRTAYQLAAAKLGVSLDDLTLENMLSIRAEMRKGR